MLFPSPETACLTLAFHAGEAWPRRERVRKALERSGERCHVCGTQVPSWMEIDHVNRDHSDWSDRNLAAICHFCHLIRHPAQPGFGNAPPLIVIRWPEIAQPALTALAWAAVRAESHAAELETAGQGAAAAPLKEVLREFEGGIRNLRQAAGAADAPPEALLTIAARGGGEPDSWSALRWYPAAAERTGDLVRWLPGGLHRVPVGEAARRPRPPPPASASAGV